MTPVPEILRFTFYFSKPEKCKPQYFRNGSLNQKSLHQIPRTMSKEHTYQVSGILDISISNSIFNKKLLDKTNEFNFNVISLPNMSSNIPINQAYSTYYSQIIRYFKANNNYSNFVNNVKCLYN